MSSISTSIVSVVLIIGSYCTLGTVSWWGDAFVFLPVPTTTKATTRRPQQQLVRTNDIDSRRVLLDDRTQQQQEEKVVTVLNDDFLRMVTPYRRSNGDGIHNRSRRDWTISSPPSPLMVLDKIDASNKKNDDAVSAILAISEEAVAVAEATLLKESPISSSSTFRAETTPIIETKVDDNDVVVVAPSVGKILLFAIPAIGVWLCNPLLSLIDTSAVGILSGTIQQAALNPAVAVTDYTSLLMAFMYTGTTNLIAAAHTKDQNDPLSSSSSRTATTLIGVLKLSTFVGLVLTVVLLLCAQPVLRTLIGNDGINPEVLNAALKYVRIRALGMPAAAMIGTAQAACLGMQDIKSPLYVLCIAAIVNFIGDLLFVGSNHAWIGGAAGAAWATVFSQYVAAGMFLHWLRHSAKRIPNNYGNRSADNSKNNSAPNKRGSNTVVNLSNAILELTSSQSNSRRQRFIHSVRSLLIKSPPREEKSSTIAGAATVPPAHSYTTNNNAPTTMNNECATDGAFSTLSSSSVHSKSPSFSVRGFLQGKLRKRDLLSFPNKETMSEFAPYVIPVTTTVIGRISGYVAMSHVVSSSLGTVSMAAQQVIVSLFYCLCPIADSLSLTAQSFFPSISDSKIGPQRSKAMKQTAINFFKAGSISGSIIVAAVSCIPLLYGFFTADPNVISLVNMVIPYLMGFFAVHGFVCAFEGLLLGQKDLGFLGKMYAVFFFIIPSLMLQVKRAALSATAGTMINLTSVWKIFMGYQFVRAAIWSLRLFFLQRKTELEGVVQMGTSTP